MLEAFCGFENEVFEDEAFDGSKGRNNRIVYEVTSVKGESWRR